MNDIQYKLNHLQACIGEKKLKQLGLIPCSTCREILSQVMNISLPSDLENKVFLTPEELSSIGENILEATHGSLKNIPSNEVFSDSLSEHNDLSSNNTILEKQESTDTEISSISTSQQIQLEKSSDLYIATTIEATPELINDLNSSANIDTKDLVSKLLSILTQSHYIAQDDLGIGYIYTPPVSTPSPHALSCSECGHLYTIVAHPTLKLIPLPVYLSDTEYEMIKGIYVDILL